MITGIVSVISLVLATSAAMSSAVSQGAHLTCPENSCSLRCTEAKHCTVPAELIAASLSASALHTPEGRPLLPIDSLACWIKSRALLNHELYFTGSNHYLLYPHSLAAFTLSYGTHHRPPHSPCSPLPCCTHLHLLQQFLGVRVVLEVVSHRLHRSKQKEHKGGRGRGRARKGVSE